MESFDNGFKKYFSFLDNDYVSTSLSLALILYASMAAPKLPASVAKLFDNTIFKLVLFFLIAYTYKSKPTVAVIAAIGVMVSIITLNRYKSNEKMLSLARNETMTSESAANCGCDNSLDKTMGAYIKSQEEKHAEQKMQEAHMLIQEGEHLATKGESEEAKKKGEEMKKMGEELKTIATEVKMAEMAKRGESEGEVRSETRAEMGMESEHQPKGVMASVKPEIPMAPLDNNALTEMRAEMKIEEAKVQVERVEKMSADCPSGDFKKNAYQQYYVTEKNKKPSTIDAFEGAEGYAQF